MCLREAPLQNKVESGAKALNGTLGTGYGGYQMNHDHVSGKSTLGTSEHSFKSIDEGR